MLRVNFTSRASGRRGFGASEGFTYSSARASCRLFHILRKSDFNFDLPAALIAQVPRPERSARRLLCVEGSSGALTDRQFTDLPTFLRPGDLLVFNDTRVIPARLFGEKESGGRIEVMLERLLS